MEYFYSSKLQEYIVSKSNSQTTFETEEIKNVLLQAARGIQYIHQYTNLSASVEDLLVNFQNGKMNVIKFSNFNLLDFPSKKDSNSVKRRSSMRDVTDDNIRKTPSGEVSQSLVEMFSNSTPGAYATFSGGFTKKKKRSAISESQKEIQKDPPQKETPLKEAKSMRALTEKKSLKFFNFVKKDTSFCLVCSRSIFKTIV